MTRIQTFQDLLVWQRAHEFVILVYKNTKQFPKEELFGLTSQLRRAAVSIAANIVEGYRKNSELDKLRLFNISQGSLEECRYYLILSKDIDYISEDAYNILNEKIQETSYLLNKYCEAIKTNKGK
jgi:four helix bundle protein